jgi:hypothetical protein
MTTKLGKAFPPRLMLWALGMMMTGRPQRRTAAAELDVPRSMPMMAMGPLPRGTAPAKPGQFGRRPIHEPTPPAAR